VLISQHAAVWARRSRTRARREQPLWRVLLQYEQLRPQGARSAPLARPQPLARTSAPV